MRSLLASPKGKRFTKTVNNVKVTLLCGFITLLVLRGTMDLGDIQILETDYSVDFHQDFSAAFRDVNRVLSVLSHVDAEDDDEDEDRDDEELVSSNATYYSLGPKVADWDVQMRAWRSLHEPHQEPRILIVTGSSSTPCNNPVGDHLLLKSIKNKMDYARLHDLQLYYSMVELDNQLVGFWSKLPLLRKLMLTHPDIEFLWWIDSAAIFTDMAFEVPIGKYEGFNLILHGWEHEVYEKKAWVGLNTGSFILRNCQWSLDLLDAWATMGPKGKVRQDMGSILSEALDGRPPFEADDQSALIYLLITQREVWGNKVFLENAYYLHGYWASIVERYEDLMRFSNNGYGDDRWPFVTHFVGCEPCGNHADYSKQRCLREMERAFNFGDNQVLEIYGFTHESLSSSTVKRTERHSAHYPWLSNDNQMHPNLTS